MTDPQILLILAVWVVLLGGYVVLIDRVGR
jgi:hypothetical protein